MYIYLLAKTKNNTLCLTLCALLCCSGCATLFGWDIHAPGLLSEEFYYQILPKHVRVALYIPDSTRTYISTNKGGSLSDPMMYHIGEAFEPMIIEAFQQAFDEFIYLEIEPDQELLKQYDIEYVIIPDITEFQNRVGLKGQDVALHSTVYVFDDTFTLAVQFKTEGSSKAKRVFAKAGGPEVNLNAAIENNIIATVQYIQDFIDVQTYEGTIQP